MSNFDFNKAINGEPIYCNGERIFPYYESNGKKFVIFNGSLYLAEWTKDGRNVYADPKHKCDLITDPPKKKVMVTAYVYKNVMGDILFTNIPTPFSIGQISGEVEI